MDSSESQTPDRSGPSDSDRSSLPAGEPAVETTTALVPLGERRLPSRLQSLWLLTSADLAAVARSWLCRGFLLVSGLLTLLQLKGMQADDKSASQMLEAVYATYLLLWMHGVIFIAGGALSRESDCLNDAVLSRGITRGEYLGGKLLARCLATFVMIGGLLLPAGFWALRQDVMVRTDSGYVRSAASNASVEAWEPKRIFAATEGIVTEAEVELGQEVRAGDILAEIDDRALFDQLEAERRGEEDALNEVANAKRRHEDSLRVVAQTEDALTQAERGLMAKDLLSRLEQADREMLVRSRKRDLKNAENQVRIASESIAKAERAVETSRAKVREARQRLSYATVIAPISGFVTEHHIQAAQHVAKGSHLLTIAPLDDYQVMVPIYQFDEFKRLKEGLSAQIKLEGTTFEGSIDRLGPMTQQDRWGRAANFVVVHFRGNGTLGLLGREVEVRLMFPPKEEDPDRLTALFNTLTGRGVDDVESTRASVTAFWMLIGLAKVTGCAFLLVNLCLLALVLFRSSLIAILAVTSLWHISNILFDFVGLPELSYLEMVQTMDKVLSGAADPAAELTSLAWLYGLTIAAAVAALSLFISRDPPK